MELKERTVWTGQHKGIVFEINRFAGYAHQRQRFCWTYYLHLLKEQFPLEDQEKVLPKIYFTQFGTGIETYNGPLDDLDWHGGLTYSSIKIKLDSPFTCLKFGCDFQHSFDDGIEYSLQIVHDEVKLCIESLFIKWPNLKNATELYDEFRTKFPGASAGELRTFDVNGNAIEHPWE